MSTARTTTDRTAPTDLPTWAIQAADLEAMLATDDDTVDTAVIPVLAYRDAVEEAAAPGASAVTSVDEPQIAAPAEQTAPPVGHSLRNRHASPESAAAIRRNLVAVACVLVSIVVIGTAVGLLAGWIALAGYALVVIGLAVALRLANAQYAPRHSRYSPRHA